MQESIYEVRQFSGRESNAPTRVVGVESAFPVNITPKTIRISLTMKEAMAATDIDDLIFCFICLRDPENPQRWEQDFYDVWNAKFSNLAEIQRLFDFITTLLELLKRAGATVCQIQEQYYVLDLKQTKEGHSLASNEPAFCAYEAEVVDVGLIQVKLEECVREVLEDGDRPTPVEAGKGTRGTSKNTFFDVAVDQIECDFERRTTVPLHHVLEFFAPLLLQEIDPEGNRLTALLVNSGKR